MALRLDVLANTRQFVAEMKKSGASVEDITDSLDEMARQGDRDTEKLERSFKELSRQADRTEKDVAAVGDKGFHKAGEASGEFKSEALANFSEVASSFDGSMESIGDTIQGTLGGVASAIPGIGIAAGVAAIGIGAITTRITEMGEEAARIKQSILDDYLDLGDALDKEAVDARVRDILGADNTRKQAELLADILDVTVGQATLALAGDFESAGVTVDEVMSGINTASGSVDFDTWNDLKNTVDATTLAMEYGKEAADAQADAQKRTAATTKEAQDKNTKEVNETAKAMRDLAAGIVPIVQPVTLKVSVNDQAWRNYRPQDKTGLIVAGPSGRTWQ